MTPERGRGSKKIKAAKETQALVAMAIRDVFGATADEALPFRFGRALGAVFVATTDLKNFGLSRRGTKPPQ